MFWELWQQGRIRAAQQAAEAARGAAKDGERRQAERAAELQLQVERLELVTAALWKVLAAKTGATDEELAQMVQEIDLADGGADGRVTPTPKVCPNCGRVAGATRTSCYYCGAALP